ncbi:MAG: hypothetical protein WCT02_01800 [Candidatus Paceibacterota bacterium]
MKNIFVALFVAVASFNVSAADNGTWTLTQPITVQNLEPLEQALLADYKVTVTLKRGEVTLPVKIGPVEYTVTLSGTEMTQIGLRIGDTEFFTYINSPDELQRVKIWSVSNPKSLKYELSAAGANYSGCEIAPEKGDELSLDRAAEKWIRFQGLFKGLRETFKVEVK